VDYKHLQALTTRGVWWVTRAKDNMKYRVIKRLKTTDDPRILSDELVKLTGFYAQQDYPQLLRRVVALVEIDGEDVEMEFLTNHLTWSARTVAELYRCRWGHRGVLQGDQTDAAVGGLPWSQRQRRALADLDRTAGASVAALSGASALLGA
jgi:hypothetical protein